MAETREQQSNSLYVILGFIIVFGCLGQAFGVGTTVPTPTPTQATQEVCVDPCRYPFIEEPCNPAGLLDLFLADYRNCLTRGGKDYDPSN